MNEIIVVVDDDKPLRRLLKKKLELCGYQVFDAANGVDALEILEQNKISVLITDLFMYGMSGIELISKAKKMLPALKVISVTGGNPMVTKLLQSKANDNGTDVFLYKPIVLTDLLNEVLTLVNKPSAV